MRWIPRSMAASVAMGLAKAFLLRVDQAGHDDGPSRLTQVRRLQKQGYPCRIMLEQYGAKPFYPDRYGHRSRPGLARFPLANFPALHLRGRFPGEHLHGDWFLPPSLRPVGSFLVLRSGLADRRSPDLDAGFSDAPLVGHLDTGHSLLRCRGDVLGGVSWFRDRLRSLCPGYARCNRSIRSPSPDRLGHNPAMPKVCGFQRERHHS